MRSPARRAAAAALAIALLLTGAPGGSAYAAPPSAQAGEAGSVSGHPGPGDRGTAVRLLQNKLIAAGTLRAHLNTGYYGNSTSSAVKRVQKKYGLSDTGRVGTKTAAAIDRAVKDNTGPATWSEKVVIGRSAGHRAITAYRAGEPGKPVVAVVATMHGEENFGQYVARGLLEGAKIEGVDLWVVPVLNPDGLAKDRRWLSKHVDLNRNFPTKWKKRANSGPKAKSAVETRVIMRFLNKIDPKYLVSWHQPLHGVDSDSVKDKALMRRLATNLKLPKKPLVCGGACHGTMTMWFNRHHAGAAITVEYGSTARSMTRMKGADADGVLAAIGGKRESTPPDPAGR